MIGNIDFDISAIAIFFVLTLSLLSRKHIKTPQNTIYIMMLICGFVGAVADIFTVITGANPEFFGRFWLNFFSLVYFASEYTIPILYAIYVITVTQTQETLMKMRRPNFGKGNYIWPLLTLPIVINVFLVLFNFKFNWLFYYDENLVYHRGAGQYFAYFTVAYLMIFGIVYITLHHKLVSREKYIAICSFLPIAAVPIFTQLFFPEYLLTAFGTAMCLMLISSTFQSQDEIVDGMTGTFNRKAFFAALPTYYYNDQPFVIVSVLINNYAFLQKTFGMSNMIIVFHEVADAMRAAVTKDSSVYSLGEFHLVIMIPTASMSDELPAKIEDIFESRTWGEGEMKIQLESQIFVISAPQDAESDDILMDYLTAETEIKHKDVITYARDIPQNDKARILEVERAIRDGLADDNFEVYYQGIYSIDSKKFNSAEALLRLHDPVLGNISPCEFIPIAERNGTILAVGMFVFRTVCEFMAQYNLKAFGVEYIEINLSVAQCMQEELAKILLSEIKKYGLETALINLEITETVAANSFDLLEDNMNELAQAGIHFSLDDYGTGYSNMVSMVELPFDFVKIDRSIVSAMDSERGKIAISGTIAMLKQMKLKIIAEGVETIEQADALAKLGCDYLQGFLYSKPAPQRQFLNLLSHEQFKN